MLEEEYGIQIFVKGSRKLKPTADGALLLKYAHRAAAISERARQALRDSLERIERLTIGITPTASDLLAPQVLAAYLDHHPNMRVEIVRNTIKNIDDMLRFYELDFAIIDGVMPGGRYDSILLGTDHLCLIAAPAHPFARRASVTFDELTHQRLVLRPQGTGTRDLLEGYLLSHGRSVQDYRVVMEIDSVSAIKEIVANGLAVSIISHNVCREEEKSGKLAVVPIEKQAAWCANSASFFRRTFSIRNSCASCRANTPAALAEKAPPQTAFVCGGVFFLPFSDCLPSR